MGAVRRTRGARSRRRALVVLDGDRRGPAKPSSSAPTSPWSGTSRGPTRAERAWASTSRSGGSSRAGSRAFPRDDATLVEQHHPVGSAIVAGRWAMTIVVRPRITSARAARISCSLVGRPSWWRRRGEDAAVGEDGPGDGHRWRFPPEKRVAVLTDHGVVALRQRLDELVGAGSSAARRTMASGASGSANADVAAHGVGEEEPSSRRCPPPAGARDA